MVRPYIRSQYRGKYLVFEEYSDYVNIYLDYIFDQMADKEWIILSYAILRGGKSILLYGNFPREKVVEIKKFFYDTFPYAVLVEPKRYSMEIHFSKKTFLIADTYI